MTRNILERTNEKILEQYASSNVLLAFDYDRTLAPEAADPARAKPRKTTRSLLERLAEAYPCVVISARTQADLAERLQIDNPLWLVGNHGIEPFDATAELAQRVARWLPYLRERLADHDGVDIEDKSYSLAIHYRRSRAKRKAREAILEAARSLEGVRSISGPLVVNLVPEGAPHKGIALERERRRLGCDTAIYVGDDEDVMSLEQPGRLLKIRVGSSRASTADYVLRDQKKVDVLLRRLLAMRRSSTRIRRESSPHPPEPAPAPASAETDLPALGHVLEFLRLIWALDHALQRTSRRMESSLGVTGPQRFVIRLVGRFPGIPAGALARLLHLHPATLSGILRRLERDGVLVRRADRRDRRRSLLGLTAKGRALDAVAMGTVEAAVRTALGGLAGRDVESAARVLGALTRTLDQDRSEAAAS